MKRHTAVFNALACSSLLCFGSAMAQSATAPAPLNSQQQTGESQLKGDDKDFVEKAAHSGYTEIEGSQLAQQKASSADVKDFAEQMITDHTAANQELAALAKQKGITPPTEPSLMQKTKLKALSATEGNTFDKMYASQIGVAAHEDAVELFQKASQEVQDPDIKAYVSKTLPKLQKHLGMAKALKQKVDAAN